MADELKDQRIPIMMSPSEVKAIDDWMFANRIKSRAQAIRRLCQASITNEPAINTIIENFSAATDTINKVTSSFSSSDGPIDEEDRIELFVASARVLAEFIDNCHPAIAKLATVYAMSKTPHDSDDEKLFNYSESFLKIHEALKQDKS